MIPTVAIVGRPNVGKSTLFNRMIGERLSIVDDVAGVTRDRIYAKAEWLNRSFSVIDTGGLTLDDAPYIEEIKAQVEVAIDEAHVIVMLCDGRAMVSDEDEAIARLLQATNKTIILALNKLDSAAFMDRVYDYYTLGLGEPMAISCEHGIGIGDLLDAVTGLLPQAEERAIDDVVRFSVIGQPNVGKSSITNAMLGEDRVIVSPVEGTTTDSIDTPFVRGKKEFVIIDTAGIRKSGKIMESTEKYAVLRAMRAIERSDVCVLVIDAVKGIQDQDKKIIGFAKDAQKAVIIAVNKWDLLEKTNDTARRWNKEIESHFLFIRYAPVIFVSAVTNKGVASLLETIIEVHQNYQFRLSTHQLNDLLQDAFFQQQPPKFQGGRLNLKYATQVATAPPTIVLFVNDPEYAHFSYLRYLENQFRAHWPLPGSPVSFVLRKRT
jgi:GTP-binding protein